MASGVVAHEPAASSQEREARLLEGVQGFREPYQFLQALGIERVLDHLDNFRCRRVVHRLLLDPEYRMDGFKIQIGRWYSSD